MQTKIKKRITSLILAASLSISTIGFKSNLEASAEDRITYYSYTGAAYQNIEMIEKNVQIYYLEDRIKDMGYSLPKNYASEYQIPEWEDYTWSTYTMNTYVDYDSFTNGTLTASDDLKAYVVHSGYDEDFHQEFDFYGLRTDGKQRIHYHLDLYNYAQDLRKQKVKEWVKENITPDMTTKEKVEAVVRKLTYGAYEGGCDAILGTSDGRCIDYSIDALYYMKELNIPSRVRYSGQYLNDSNPGFIDGHHNNWVLIDGDLYIVEFAPWYNKRTEGYLDTLESNFNKIEDLEFQTDGKYVYSRLEDGTLELFDIPNLEYELPETWVIPTETTIDGKEYKVSTLGPICYLTTCYTSFPTVKKIIIPDGMKINNDHHGCFNSFYFPNLKELVLGNGVNSLDFIALTGYDYKPIKVDAVNTIIDTANGDPLTRLDIIPISGDVTVYTDVTEELQAAYDKDMENNPYYRWNLIDTSNPDSKKIILTVDDPENKTVNLYKGVCKNAIAPFEVHDNVYEYPYLTSGEYRIEYIDNGVIKERTITLGDEDLNYKVNANTMNYVEIGIGILQSDNSSILNEQQEADVRITDSEGNLYKVEKAKSNYFYKIYGLPDGTYEINAKLYGYYCAAPYSITIKNGESTDKSRRVFWLEPGGDLDRNGKIDVFDLLIVKRHMIGYQKLSNYLLQKADINGDSKVDMLDIMGMKKHIIGYKKMW